VNIILLGAPGSGKGTQATGLVGKYGVAHISTGNIFREEIGKKSPLGLRVESYLKSGQLVPDSLTVDVVAGRLEQPDARKGFLMDGFPRTVGQAEALDAYLKKNGQRIDAVVSLDVDDEEVVHRLSSRRSCGTCGKIYNLQSQPPKAAGKCDADGAALVQREDDKPETIRKRLAVFHEQTAPLKAYYQKAGLLRSVKGTGAPEAVGKAVDEALHAPAR